MTRVCALHLPERLGDAHLYPGYCQLTGELVTDFRLGAVFGPQNMYRNQRVRIHHSERPRSELGIIYEFYNDFRPPSGDL